VSARPAGDSATQEQTGASEHVPGQPPPSSADGQAVPDTIVYSGLVTRSIAFFIDAAVINGVAALVGVMLGLGVSILHLPSHTDKVLAAIGTAAWVLWGISYFGFFWSTTGQTPGDRLMQIRVLAERTRRPVRPLQAAVRFGGLILAAIPLGAGYLMMLWDDRGRCLQDRLARTVVIYAPREGLGRGEQQRRERRLEGDARSARNESGLDRVPTAER
jgi:uncharacterized RDD family membrane protein YckC